MYRDIELETNLFSRLTERGVAIHERKMFFIAVDIELRMVIADVLKNRRKLCKAM